MNCQGNETDSLVLFPFYFAIKCAINNNPMGAEEQSRAEQGRDESGKYV